MSYLHPIRFYLQFKSQPQREHSMVMKIGPDDVDSIRRFSGTSQCLLHLHASHFFFFELLDEVDHYEERPCAVTL